MYVYFFYASIPFKCKLNFYKSSSALMALKRYISLNISGLMRNISEIDRITDSSQSSNADQFAFYSNYNSEMNFLRLLTPSTRSSSYVSQLSTTFKEIITPIMEVYPFYSRFFISFYQHYARTIIFAFDLLQRCTHSCQKITKILFIWWEND